MTQPSSRFERFLERAAGLGLNTSIHPATLLQQVQDAAVASVSESAIANAYTISIAAADLRTLRPHLDELRGAIIPMLAELATSRRLSRPGPWEVEFVAADSLAPGQSQIRTWYRNPRASGSSAAPAQTQVIRRLRNAFLDVSGLGRVRLTHTPFTIGRTADCDLAIPDLEISRRHARIESTPEGLVINDLGSRNRITVLGETVEAAPLVAGTPIRLGSTEITLQFDP